MLKKEWLIKLVYSAGFLLCFNARKHQPQYNQNDVNDECVLHKNLFLRETKPRFSIPSFSSGCKYTNSY